MASERAVSRCFHAAAASVYVSTKKQHVQERQKVAT
jgi:hypothetical protein